MQLLAENRITKRDSGAENIENNRSKVVDKEKTCKSCTYGRICPERRGICTSFKIKGSVLLQKRSSDIRRHIVRQSQKGRLMSLPRIR